MDVTQLWKKIVVWLGDHAPVTAATLQPPDPSPDFGALEREFGVRLPAELREWWLCCGGTEEGVLADVLPPFYTPYGARGAWQTWCALREPRTAQWDRPTGDHCAGSATSGYHPAWIPIAGDGFADELVMDLRPGRWHGCVLEWEQETAQLHTPEWSGISAMLADVWRALDEGVPAGHSYPTVTEDGRIDWQIR
ncbi:SMI1/KNR4 family protein [Haloactinomyces albus]|uniref:Cell wall assembly regulator SMI1 n=1 Tax=Haloactinomyces albus TaxID=1352928 RepID=A0AAE4CMP1_9ACTN|nr:SMI1/KNR4 family protein [Haloactinomyces albus]MDR7302636.1 cell wall assembly regulator SMI1 [Haloactinomyces albus]